MVTNQPIAEFHNELKVQSKDISIAITPTIGASVNFLDVIVTNVNDRLRTSVYHQLTTELDILPGTSDHPRHIHHNIPYATLLRAARPCSDVADFNVECIRIDRSLLLNHYPPNFMAFILLVSRINEMVSKRNNC